jgi:hypothetical protein
MARRKWRSSPGGPGLLVGFVIASAMTAARPAQAGCTRDNECKGVRICEDGKCVWPPKEIPTPQATPAPAAPVEQAGAQPAGEKEATAAGEAGPAPTAVAPAPPAAAPAPPAPPIGGALHLTPAQVAALKSAGATLDENEMGIADSLGKRGFRGDEFVAAYRDHVAVKARYPELAPYGTSLIETIVVARRLGLDRDQSYWFTVYRHQRERTLTQAYNEEILGGPSLLKSGLVTSGTGLALIIIGAELRSIARDHPTYYQGSGNEPDHRLDYPGAAMEIVGGLALVAGIPFALVGAYRMHTWLPPGTLDTARAGSIRTLRPAAANQDSLPVRFALTPTLGQGQAGLGLTASF